MIELEDNKSRAGIGYPSGVSNTQGLFKSGGFIHTVKMKRLLPFWKKRKGILAISSSLEGSAIIGSMWIFQQLSISQRNVHFV